MYICIYRWSVSEMDIRSTLKKVCEKVLSDQSIDEKNQLKRLEGLKKLGESFIHAANMRKEVDNGEEWKNLFRQEMKPRHH